MSTMERKHGLDILRVIAILLVVIHHIPRPENIFFPFWFLSFSDVGWSGVDLFFVLSGFLIAGQVFQAKTNEGGLKSFWIKRWFRTLPLYYVVLFVYTVVKPMMGYSFRDNAWEYLFFTQNYLSPMDFVQSWSLCIEEHFYLVFPVLIYLFNFKKMNPFIWLLPLLLSLLSRYYLYHYTDIISAPETTFAHTVRFMTHNHLDGISMGVFLAKTYDFWKEFSRTNRNILGVLGFGLVFIALYQSGLSMRGPIFIYSFTLLAFGFGLLLICFHDFKLNKLAYIPVEKIALWSYGIYIWNHLLIRKFEHTTITMPWYTVGLAFTLLSIGSGASTYYTIEKPFLNLRNKILAKMSH